MEMCDILTCSLCGCILTEINEGIDHIQYENWNGEVITICLPCLESVKEALYL